MMPAAERRPWWIFRRRSHRSVRGRRPWRGIGRRWTIPEKPSCRLRIRTPGQCIPGHGSEWATTSRSLSTPSTNLIAEQQVHSKVADLGLLAETATAARENLAVDEIDAVADRGYYKIEDIEDCEAAGITPYVPKPDRSTARRSGHFPKSDFQYDDATDTYRCPAGERLVPLYRRSVGKSRTGTYLVSYANRAACRGCGPTRTMYQEHLSEHHALRERSNDGAHGEPSRRPARGDGSSPGVGRASLRSIKQWMGQGAFLTRRLGNVRGEFSLTALAYNMRRAINLVGIPALIAVAAV